MLDSGMLGFAPATVARRRGRLGHLRRLCLRFEFGLGGADALQPPLLVPHPVRRLITAPVGTLLGVFRRIGCRGPIEPAGYLGRQLVLGLGHPSVTHRLVLGGVRLDLRAVERHVAKFHQTGLAAQRQHLSEQTGQSREVPLAEVADRPEVRPVQSRHRLESKSLLARARGLPR
jgi:hypothetical protein